MKSICLVVLVQAHWVDLPKIFESDIKITDEQHATFYKQQNVSKPGGVQSAVAKDDTYKWANNLIPYIISSDFNSVQKELIRAAIRDIETAVPCIRYEEHFTAPVGQSYLNVHSGSGCWSYVGAVFPGAAQPLSIRIDDCVYKDIITHEFVHALGVWHEQSRPDRDNYITIHPENMYEETEGNFEIQTNTWDRNSPYDPNSIMHYENYAFSKNGQMTITWNADPKKLLGGQVLSASDVYQLNSYYGCSGITEPTTSTTTKQPATTSTTTKQPATTSTATKQPATTSTTTKQLATTSTTTKQPATTSTTTKQPATTSTTTKQPATTSTTTKQPATKSTTTKQPTIVTITTTDGPTTDCGDTDFLKCVSAYRYPVYYCRDKTYEEICPQSCGVCTAGDVIQCNNFKDDPNENCSQRAYDGQCYVKNYQLRKDMKIKCSKTCCEQGRLYY